MLPRRLTLPNGLSQPSGDENRHIMRLAIDYERLGDERGKVIGIASAKLDASAALAASRLPEF